MPEATATQVRLPNPRYSEQDFEPDWFRIIVLSEEKGISALIGKLKSPDTGPTAVKTYVFEVEKGWDLKAAEQWVADHNTKAEVPIEVTDQDVALALLVTPDIIERYGRPEKVYRDWHGRFTKPKGPNRPVPDRPGRINKLLKDQQDREDAAKAAAAEAKKAQAKAKAEAIAAANKAIRDAERAAAKAEADAKAAAKKAESDRIKAEKEQTAAAEKAAKESKAEAEKAEKLAAKARADAERAAAKLKADAEKADAKAKADADKAAKETERKQAASQREAQRIAQAAERERQTNAAKVARELDQRVSSIKSQIASAGGSVEKVQSMIDRAEDIKDQMTAKNTLLDSAKKRADAASREITRLKRQLDTPDLTPAEQDGINRKIDAVGKSLDTALARVSSLEVDVRKSDRDLRRLQAQAGKERGMINEAIVNLKKLLGELRSKASSTETDMAGKIEDLTAKLERLEHDWKNIPASRAAVLASMTSIAEDAEDIVLDYGDGEINRIADEFYAIDPDAEEVPEGDVIASVKVGGFLVNMPRSGAPVDKGSSWSFGADDAKALLGPDGNDWKQFAAAHMMIDVRDGGSASDLPASQDKYLFPMAKMVDGKLTYFPSAAPAMMADLNGAHGVAGKAPWWSPAIRQTAYKGIKAMYGMMDKEAPEMMMSHSDSGYGFEMKLAGDGQASQDGLTWKPVLRVGKWAGVDGGKPLEITSQLIDDVVAAFNAGVIEHVDVPVGHDGGVDRNTGFVKALRRQGDELWAGIDFTEPSIKDLVLRGTIANVSCWLKGDFQDWRDGKKWPWVLWHVALTNKPMITELAPFGEAQARMSVHRFSMENGKEEHNMDPKEGKDDVKLSKEEHERLLSATAELDATRQRLAALELAKHKDDVKQIVAALQGRGIHEAVKLPANSGFAPAVLQVVQPYLENNLGQPKEIKLSRDGKEVEESVTDVVLSVLNAIAHTSPGALISTAAPTVVSGAIETDTEAVNKRVDGYLAARGLAPKQSK